MAKYRLFNADALVTMEKLRGQSVDLVLTDPPYGTTNCKWDSIIPLESMWGHLNDLCNGTIALMASQPYTSVLICSNLSMFKYCWVWDKVNKFSGHLNAKKQPMRQTEDVVVFCKGKPTYNPQMQEGKPYTAISSGRKSNNYGTQSDKVKTVCSGERYPRNIIQIKGDERGTVGRLHPTQKPIALMEYLIKTYSNEGDTVLDFAMGSGTTGVACGNLNRNFIGIDNDKEHGYFKIARKRIREAYNG